LIGEGEIMEERLRPLLDAPLIYINDYYPVSSPYQGESEIIEEGLTLLSDTSF